MKLIESIKQSINRAKTEIKISVNEPRAQLTRYQRAFRYCFDLAMHARRELREHSAPTMAAALTYRTIFGLVPMLIMALIVFRAFGGFGSTQEGITNAIYNMLQIQMDVVSTPENLREDSEKRSEQIEAESSDASEDDDDAQAEKPPSDSQDQVPPIDDPAPDFSPDAEDTDTNSGPDPPDTSDTTDAPDDSVEPTYQADSERNALDQLDTALAIDPDANDSGMMTNEQMKRTINKTVSGLAGRVSEINIGSIGVAGTIILIWAALGLIVTVERNFNVIFNAPSGRPWHVRIPIYWAVITLGPVLIWASFYFSTQFLEVSSTLPGVPWIIAMAKRFFSLLVTWLLVFILFKLMPNTAVALRPALIGSFFSAVCWEGMKAALRWYIDNAVVSPTQSALYGQLALIPILLLWTYVTWLIILAGLEITHLIQTLPASRMGEVTTPSSTNAADPWLVIPILATVAEAFSKGKTVTTNQLANSLNLPSNIVSEVTSDLMRKGLLHETEGEDGQRQLLLAMPAEKIQIHDIIESAHPTLASDAPGRALLQQVAEAQRKALANVRLSSASDASEHGANI